MDKEKFKANFPMKRMHFIIDFCEEQKGWFEYEKLFTSSIAEAKERHKQLGRTNSLGSPSNTKSCIAFLIKNNYLLADPKKGLKRNPKFIPIDQKV